MHIYRMMAINDLFRPHLFVVEVMKNNAVAAQAAILDKKGAAESCGMTENDDRNAQKICFFALEEK